MPEVMIYVLAVRLSLLLCPFIDDAEVLAIFICGDKAECAFGVPVEW